MAGGIEWFRWHHGSVTDPKFQLVARKAKASLPDVIAIWAYVLEQASASEVRGEFVIDAEAVDCMFGLDDGTTQNVIEAMAARGLVDGNKVASWSKRQPKRERPDDVTATERKRQQRERDMAGKPPVTPSHAASRQVTPRGEESRVEENNSLSPPSEAVSKTEPVTEAEPETSQDAYTATLKSLPAEVIELWQAWLDLREFKHGAMSEIQLEAVFMELMRRGDRMIPDLQMSILKGSKNIIDSTVDYSKPNARASPGGGQGKLTKGERIKQEAGF